MRQIKFRAKTIANGHWVYGNLIIRKNGYVSIRNSKSEPWVDPSTVGQFTGLTDCNGKEIYEGDVLELNPITRIQGYVRWDDALAQFIVNIIDSKQWYCIENGVVEVIGNVFDNPELIPNQPTAI